MSCLKPSLKSELPRLLLSAKFSQLVINDKDRRLRSGSKRSFCICDHMGVELSILEQVPARILRLSNPLIVGMFLNSRIPGFCRVGNISAGLNPWIPNPKVAQSQDLSAADRDRSEFLDFTIQGFF